MPALWLTAVGQKHKTAAFGAFSDTYGFLLCIQTSVGRVPSNLSYAAGEFNLQFATSTQACAAVVVAFQALKVNQQALVYLIEEWTQLGISQVHCILHLKKCLPCTC